MLGNKDCVHLYLFLDQLFQIQQKSEYYYKYSLPGYFNVILHMNRTCSIQRRIDEALAKKQAEAVAAKREKANNTDNTSELTEAQLSYIAQKSALEAQSGSKGEESGKWLVR